MAGILDGLRVIDLSSGPAGGIATMVLADFGADVIKVERPGGDPLRSIPSAQMWLRGKRSVALDLKRAEERERLHALVKTADVVVASYRGEAGKALGADAETLTALHPGLIYCRITGFGPRGSLASVPGYEGVVAAKSGRMMAFAGLLERAGPQFAAVQVGVHASSQAAVTGIIAGLVARDRDGHGQIVDASLLQGMMAYDMGGLLNLSLQAWNPGNWAAPALLSGRMPTINYQPVLAGDGRWIQLGNLLQHLFDNFLAASDLTDIYADGDHDGSPASWKEEVREAFRDRMLQHMRSKTSDEWMRIFVEQGGVVATPFQTTQDALSDPDLVMNGHVIETPGPNGGTMKQIGPVARLTETPAQIRHAVPAIGQHTAEVFGALPAAKPAPAGAPSNSLALEGVTVLDFSTIIAAPLGATHLADLGARVIKVEQSSGDPWRWMGNGSLGALKTNASKESICVDLKAPEGQAAVHALIARADIIIHNYRPGVPGRLGISYEHASAVNPGIVYVNVNGYGPLGPSAHRPATHPIPGAALGGATWQSGGIPVADTVAEMREGARKLFRSNEVNPDPNTSAVVATTAMLGLWARRATGRGQEIFIDMMGANAYANHDDFFSYDGREPRPAIDPGLHGTSADYRLYRASSGWVFLGIGQDTEWQRFCAAASADLGGDARYATRAGRREHGAALIEALTTLFATRTADEWEALLTPHGIGCVRADGPAPPEYFFTSPQMEANGFTARVRHTAHGDYQRHGAMIQMSRSGNRLAAGPMAGEHTDALLREIGRTDAEITSLRAAGVVWSEPGAPVLVSP
ncbi:MAG: CoA transferase [Chloroflexi bacterium]|nr:CoA transferase [Chloroflexota bacterium]MQC48345.1 CoA transferase [Chloroflexota bacterium]